VLTKYQKIWNVNKDECIQTFLGHSGIVTCILKISKDLIATGSFDKSIRFWNLLLDNNNCVLIIDEAHCQFIRELDIISKNLIASCSDDSTIKVWNLNTGKCIKTLYGHKSYVCSINVLSSKVN